MKAFEELLDLLSTVCVKKFTNKTVLVLFPMPLVQSVGIYESFCVCNIEPDGTQ